MPGVLTIHSREKVTIPRDKLGGIALRVKQREAPPVLERLGIDATIFGMQVREFGNLFSNVVGKPNGTLNIRYT